MREAGAAVMSGLQVLEPAARIAPEARAVPNEPAGRLNRGAYPTPGLAPVSWRGYYYPDASDEQWNDWRWQFRNRLVTLAQWDRFFPLSEAERAALSEVMRE